MPTYPVGVLQGKVIAITGGGRGIGRAIALQCARDGACVVVNDSGSSESGEGVDMRPAHDVVAEIETAGGRAVANCATITEAAGAGSIIEDALSNFGKINAVVNNAGFIRDVIFHKMNDSDWDAVIDVHLNGYFYVARAAAPYFRGQGSRAYVHLTSGAALIGSVGQANYAAAKMGVVGLSTSIALDMRRFGVRSNCVAPWAWTRGVRATSQDTPERQRWRRHIEQSPPEKIAPLVAFLCSDLADGVTGQIFGVRKNELFLFSRPHLIRTAHNGDGWTPQTIGRVMLPMLQPSFEPLWRSSDVISWDPV